MLSYLLSTIGLLVGVVNMVGTPVGIGVVVQIPIGDVVVRIPIGVGVQRREGACLLGTSCCYVVRWRSLLLQPI